MAVFEQARRYPGQEQQVVEYYQKNPQAMQQLAGPILKIKSSTISLELAKVTEVETTADALYASLEESVSKESGKPAAKKTAKRSRQRKQQRSSG